MQRVTQLLIFICLLSTNTVETERIGITLSKPSVLIFREDILDVELGNKDYSVKIKGKSLLMFAKSKDSKPTTLFVRYGANRDFYIAEIFTDDNAPIQRFINGQPGTSREGPKANQPYIKEVATKRIFLADEKQEYYNYGFIKDGIKVILTNIRHQGNETYLRIFIENNTTTNLTLSNFTFEYITYLRKFLFFKSKKSRVVTPVIVPLAIELSPQSANYFVFAIPSYTSNGGLEIFIGESDQGEREFKLSIPTKVLIQAKRK